jgi:hypothetical protein
LSHFTIDTLEDMFVYLGCANIETREAMDGAVPLESIVAGNRGAGKAVAELAPERLESLGSSWELKSVCFRSGDRLTLSTIQNVHWSVVSNQLSLMRSQHRKITPCHASSFTDRTDAYVNLYYSEIDEHGKFIKFPIKKTYMRGMVVSRIYNPRWLFEFRKGYMQVISSDSDSVYQDVGLGFLAPFMCGLAQSLPTYWRVATRFDAVCPSLTLLTDPTGVKEFWKLRDIPEGKSRRAALLHWVECHWRQNRKDPDVEGYVRKHLRGQQELTQGQFSAKITPSETDSIEEESLKRMREELRVKKLDRRRRLGSSRASNRTRRATASA